MTNAEAAAHFAKLPPDEKAKIVVGCYEMFVTTTELQPNPTPGHFESDCDWEPEWDDMLFVCVATR